MAYSHILLSCSVPRRRISACPLAFGEVGVKSRISGIWKNKKTTVFALIAFILAVIIIFINFMTSSPDKPSLPSYVTNVSCGSDYKNVEIDLVGADFSTIYPYFDIKWKNRTADSLTFGEDYTVFIWENGKWEAVYDPEIVYSIGYMGPALLSTTHRYSAFCIEKSGTYRFEAPFFFDKDHTEKYTVWCEFEVSEGSYVSTVKEYEKASVAFAAKDFDRNSEVGEKLEISANPFGFFVSEGGMEYDVQETAYSDDVKDLLSKCYSPESSHKASVILSDNNRMWEGIYTEEKDGKSTVRLTFIFEQSNGELYLAKGYCLDVTDDILSPENSRLEIIYKLSNQ